MQGFKGRSEWVKKTNQWFLKLGFSLFFLIAFKTQALSMDDTAQSFAKAGAVTAELGNIESGFKNPASLKGSQEWLCAASSYFDGAYYSSLIAYSFFVKKANMAVYFPFKMINDIPETIYEWGQAKQISSYSETQLSPRLSLCYPLGPFQTGVTFAYDRHVLFKQYGEKFSMDWGACYTQSFFSLAVSSQNLISTPLMWSTGRQEEQNMDITLGSECRLEKACLKLDLAIQKQETLFSSGFSYQIHPSLTLLAGMKGLGKTNQWRAGLTLSKSCFSFTYALGDHQDLGLTHKISISIQAH